MGNKIGAFFNRHPTLHAFIDKVMKDNIGMLASVVAWTLFTSLIPIVVGLVAISGLVLRDPATQTSVKNSLVNALQGAISSQDIDRLIKVAVQHTGLLGIIGVVGILYGGSNVGSSISTVFQPIFRVRGRDFIPEKLIDVAMIFVFTVLMVVIFLGTTAGAMLDRLLTGYHVPGVATFAVGILVSLLAAFLLFAVIYVVFPHTYPRFKFSSVWPGASIAAVLFTALSFIWPLYSSYAHFSRYGAVLGSIVILTAWIYFFAMILMIGAEFVAFRALQEAKERGVRLGPAEDGNVPQHAPLDESEIAPAKETA